MNVLDHSVYPDLDDPPDELFSLQDRADYVHRVCGAWDFGVPPTEQTFELFRSWREVFDRFPIMTSPAYHAFRAWLKWPPLPPHAPVVGLTFQWEIQDRLEDRLADPCIEFV